MLSPSDPEQDTETKRAAYARAGVFEYRIIAPRRAISASAGKQTPPSAATPRCDSEELEAKGWRISVSTWSVEEEESPRSIGLFELAPSG